MSRKGFTLIEVAIVMVILGLIIGLGIPMYRMLVQQNELAEDRAAVKEAKQALIGYAFTVGKLPLPDGDHCLPYKTLGTRQTDSHGNVLIYDVRDNLTKTKNPKDFCKMIKILECEDNKSAGSPGGPIVDGHSVAFVVISKGSDYKLDSSDNVSTREYENPQHPYDAQTANDIVEDASFGYLYGLCIENGLSDNSTCP